MSISIKMKKYTVLSAIGVLSLSCVFSWLVFWNGPDGNYSIEKTIQYSFTVSNITNQLVEVSDIYVYAPVKESTLQKTLSIESNKHYETVQSESGNQLLRFRLKDLPPFGSKVIRIRARIAFAESPVAKWNSVFSGQDLEGYIGPALYVETESPLLKTQADGLKQSSDVATAKATYSWVSNRLTDEGYVEQDRGALHAYHSKVGDCTEFMYLYMALARINGIASRGMGGFIVKNNSVLDPRNYHNWSQSYLDGRWRNVDANRNVFLKEETQYVSFRILGNKNEESGKGLSQSLAYVDPKIADKLNIVMDKGA